MCQMTYHAQVERKNRVEYIIDTIGIGETVAKCPAKGIGRTKNLTSTGVVIVTANDNGKLITMYIGTIDEIMYIYRQGTGRHEMPPRVYKNARNAQKYRKNCPND